MQPYTLRRSDRRTLSLEITPQGEVLVRAPRRIPEQTIHTFVEKHDAWIKKHLAARKTETAVWEQLSPEQQAELARLAGEDLGKRVAYWSKVMDLVPTGVKITGAARRFGSCSGKNSLCFSWRLMRYPPEAIDYVVVHELAHRKEMNHSERFWAEVARILPDYKIRRKWLKENGGNV